tara:strand:+ start:190 stop:636 length:447 start_codon:yes stop_codon:yes gene_type:complete
MESSNEVYNNNVNSVTHNSVNNSYHLLLNDITNDKNYSDLTNIIESCYEKHEYFNLIIETKNLERKKIHMKYLYKLAQFLKKMKNNETTYLLKTTIHVYDDFTNNLLYTLFTFLCSPLAQVEIIYYKSRNNNNNLENIKKINNYYPHK